MQINKIDDNFPFNKNLFQEFQEGSVILELCLEKTGYKCFSKNAKKHECKMQYYNRPHYFYTFLKIENLRNSTYLEEKKFHAVFRMSVVSVPLKYLYQP